MTALTCLEVTAGRSGRIVLNGVSLSVRDGEILGVSGPSSSGKSTLLDVIAGSLAVTRGQILLDGRDVTRARVQARAALGVRLVRPSDVLFATMTVKQHFLLAEKRRRPIEPSLFAPLREAQDLPAIDLSGGMRRLLASEVALRSGPNLLLFDDFSEGLQASAVRILSEEVKSLISTTGIAAVIVDSDRTVLQRVCSSVLDLGAAL